MWKGWERITRESRERDKSTKGVVEEEKVWWSKIRKKLFPVETQRSFYTSLTVIAGPICGKSAK
jgi:hypothetical protein